MTIIHVTAEGKAVVLSPSHPPRRAVPSSYIHPRLRHKPVTLVAPMLDAHVIAATTNGTHHTAARTQHVPAAKNPHRLIWKTGY